MYATMRRIWLKGKTERETVDSVREQVPQDLTNLQGMGHKVRVERVLDQATSWYRYVLWHSPQRSVRRELRPSRSSSALQAPRNHSVENRRRFCPRIGSTAMSGTLAAPVPILPERLILSMRNLRLIDRPPPQGVLVGQVGYAPSRGISVGEMNNSAPRFFLNNRRWKELWIVFRGSRR